MTLLAGYGYRLCLCAALCGAWTWAQPTTSPGAAATTSSAARATSDMQEKISDHMQSGDPAVVTEAVTEIHQLLQANAQQNGNVFRTIWLKRLLQLQRYDDIVDLSLPAILASPADTPFVEQMQNMRVQALLGEGKPADALAAAKQLFNVSTLKGTADAIRMVCQCLNAVDPSDRNVLRQYRNEQIAGTGPNSSAVEGGASSLSKVEIDPDPYQAAINQITAEDFRSLTAQGNLMLLAGRANDAWEVFERAYTMASDRDLPAATESLARCIKAQDGTIGRANAWILSLRPQAQVASEHSIGFQSSTTQPTRQE